MYTDRYGDHWIDEYTDIIHEDLADYSPATREHVIAGKPATYRAAVALATEYLAPLEAFPNVGPSADYCESAYLVAGSLGSPHVVVFDDSNDNDERPYIVLHHPGGDDDHPATVAGPFASPSEAIAAAREFAASIGLD